MTEQGAGERCNCGHTESEHDPACKGRIQRHDYIGIWYAGCRCTEFSLVVSP